MLEVQRVECYAERNVEYAFGVLSVLRQLADHVECATGV